MSGDLVIFEIKEEWYRAMSDTAPVTAPIPPRKISYKYFAAIKSHLKSYPSKFILLQKDAPKDQQ